jgi:hypothetical protein
MQEAAAAAAEQRSAAGGANSLSGSAKAAAQTVLSEAERTKVLEALSRSRRELEQVCY